MISENTAIVVGDNSSNLPPPIKGLWRMLGDLPSISSFSPLTEEKSINWYSHKSEASVKQMTILSFLTQSVFWSTDVSMIELPKIVITVFVME